MKALRILNLEDNPLDTELIHSILTDGGVACEITRVQTRAEFVAALEQGCFDMILSDYWLPSFDGLSALKIRQEISSELPFILVSGTLGEDAAIESLTSGATDYVLKHRLERLVPAVRRAVHEAEERIGRKRAEEALREVREAERSRIARDLHDGVLQDLIYALGEAQLIRTLSEDQQLHERLDQEIAALKRATQGLRSAVYDLRLEESAQRSLVSSVEDLVDLSRTMGQGRYEVELVVEQGFPCTLSGRLGTELVRIIQEALSNARRHSQAKNIRVVLGVEGNDCLAEVEDDGRGFEPDSSRRGVGMSSMRERAEALGGDVEVESEPGKGTRVRARLPLRHDREE